MLPGGAATLRSEVCAGIAPGHTAPRGTAVHSFCCLPGQTWSQGCLAGLAGACVCLVSPHVSEMLAQQPNHRLGQLWWSVQDCVPAASPLGSLLSPHSSAFPGGSLTLEGWVKPVCVSQTVINVGILITKPFIFPLMNNTLKMHTRLVFSVWK